MPFVLHEVDRVVLVHCAFSRTLSRRDSIGPDRVVLPRTLASSSRCPNEPFRSLVLRRHHSLVHFRQPFPILTEQCGNFRHVSPVATSLGRTTRRPDRVANEHPTKCIESVSKANLIDGLPRIRQVDYRTRPSLAIGEKKERSARGEVRERTDK